MSTYLLLRNNKQTGPFTIDELKKMSLKAYDLVWVEGKSAAWRYPGEIPEFNSFAPQAPEQPYDRFYKKAVPESALKETKVPVPEPSGFRESFPNQSDVPREETYGKPVIIPRESNKESVYINLPAAEKKQPVSPPAASTQQPVVLNWEEPIREAANLPGRKGKPKKKWLLIASVTLFFAAGMVTGFYISNRRDYYATDGNSPQTPASPLKSSSLTQISREHAEAVPGSTGKKIIKPLNPSITKAEEMRAASGSKKKQKINTSAKEDSIHTVATPVPVVNSGDSLRKSREAARIALAAKIKAHPEEYLLISMGNYKTGVLGGISEVPVSITNRSGVVMDLVVVAVDYIQHNKKIYKTENLSFHNLAPGATVTAEAPRSSRGVKVLYRLTIANSQQIGMSYSNI